MGKVIVEPDKERGGFVALQNHKPLVRGGTQKQAGSKAHDLRPNDTIEAARVRTTPEGHPDEFRRKLYGPNHKK